MTSPVLPHYGSRTLADLLPSLAAEVGLSGTNLLGIPSASRYLVVLIDGLGAQALNDHAELAPFLTGLPGNPITSGVPSTTATSITSFGTGLAPGAHGVAGYTFWYRPTQAVLNALRWPAGIDPADVQPQLTYFERLAKAGVGAGVIAPAAFNDSGLTNLALRGATFWPVYDETDPTERAELAVAATSLGERNVSYCYERSLDHAGHAHGVDSAQWRTALEHIDALVAGLRAMLPDDISMVITADHGMIDVPTSARVVVEDVPGLMDDVAGFAGEGRLRHLMVEPGREQQVALRWRRLLGDQAWVRTRDEAIDEGWFGPVSPRWTDRFGDVIVAMAHDGAIMSRSLAGEMNLVGMHGSLTAPEMIVPLLVA